MNKPIILTVDDDADVLQAIARDLRQQYGDRFRIIHTDSGATAISHQKAKGVTIVRNPW